MLSRFPRISMVTPAESSTRPPAVRTLRRLSGLLTPYRGRFAVAGVALLVAAGCMLAMGQGLKLVVDRGFSASDPHALDQALVALLAIIGFMAIATYVRFYNVSWIGERVTADLRRRVFDHLLTLSPGFFEITRTGEVISRLTNDTTMLETVIGSSLSLALRNVVLGIGALILLTLTSLKLTLLVLAGPAAGGAADHPVRAACAARAREPGPGRRHGGARDEAIHEIRTVQARARAKDRAGYAQRVEARSRPACAGSASERCSSRA
jgi:ATP-binding cassette subfamily B protein